MLACIKECKERKQASILLHPASVLFLLMGLLYLLDLADIKFVLPAESGGLGIR